MLTSAEAEVEAARGPFPELAHLVRQITNAASSRGIAQRAPISHASAAKLIKGQWVNPNTLLLFATGYRVPLNPLREAMGLDPLSVDPTASLGRIWAGSQGAEVVKLSDGRTVTITGLEASPEDKELVKSLIRRLMRPG